MTKHEFNKFINQLPQEQFEALINFLKLTASTVREGEFEETRRGM